MGKIAKLDDDGNVILETAVDTTFIKVDGQDVEVPQSAAQILEKAEHDLKSRNERALRESRESLSALLSEDTRWYAEHPAPELWEHYEPKVNGGKGFTGDPTMLNQKPEVKVESTPTAVIDDTKVKALEEKIAQQEAALTQIQNGIELNNQMKVVEIKDAALRRYPEANPKSVQKELQAFYFTNGRHPNATEIEGIVKENHDFVSTRIEANKPVIPSGIPPVVSGGTPPPPASLSKSKTPRLEDIDAWKGLAHADNVTPG